MRWLLYINLLFSIHGRAQQRIQNFNVFTAGSGVTVKFTITQGAQCSGYSVSHSSDSIYFNEIYNYPGTCGASKDQDVSYIHSSPINNAVNYYKVELFPVEVSPVKRVFVNVAPTVKLAAYPNPIINVNDLLTLRVHNTNDIQLRGFISNQFGEPVRQLDLVTQADLVSLNVGDLCNGLYIVWLNDKKGSYSVKILINR